MSNTLVKIVVMIEGGDGSGGLRDGDIKAVRPFVERGNLGYETGS